MKISKENKSDLNAVVTIDLSPEDYVDKVEQVLKQHQKKANVPGFRPGKAPIGFIKKMVGKSVLTDELQKIINDSLFNYLSENKINFLGHPIPKEDVMNSNDWENPKDFKFSYEIGIAPEVNLNLDDNIEFEFYLPIIDDDTLEKYLEDIKRRYGNLEHPESVEESTIMYGSFEELNENDNTKEGGVTTTTTLALDIIDPSHKEKFLGKKKDDEVFFNPHEAIKDNAEVAAMLNIPVDNPSIYSKFKFKIKTINKLIKAEIGKELFDKMYGEGAINSEDEFRQKVREDVIRAFSVDANKKLKADIEHHLLDTVSLELPEDFLKKWISTSSMEPVSSEEIEKDFAGFSKKLKLQLLSNQVLKEKNIEITEEEVKEQAKRIVQNQLAQYGYGNADEALLEKYTEQYLKEKDHYYTIRDAVASQKAFDFLKSHFKINTVELPFEEFREKVIHGHKH